MFNRKIEKELGEWKDRKGRKPLVLRGARQTGKTTVIRKLAKNFKVFIELNLEKDNVKKIFSEIRDIQEVIQSIEAHVNQRIIPGETLLFLDEIQNSLSAIKLLRYFHEESPELHVVSAGSLLEVRMKSEGWSFPVGRVEFLYLYPVTFSEFLEARKEQILLETLMNYSIEKTIPLPIHARLIELFADYIVIGGMPEAVEDYLENQSFTSVRRCLESLDASIKEDFGKYSKSSEVEFLRLIWEKVPFEAGKRIKYSKLAGGLARSKDISAAFDILHDAMLVERILPTVSGAPPLAKKIKSAPKAMFLDIGLCLYRLNLSRDHIKARLIDPLYSGGIFEEAASQELMALDFHNRTPLYFWTREEKSASSEVDFLLPINEKLVPIEVKSGQQGALKSLHQFLYRSGGKIGIRIYNGEAKLEKHLVTLPTGEKLNYQLLSIPFYFIFRIRELCKSAGIG